MSRQTAQTHGQPNLSQRASTSNASQIQAQTQAQYHQLHASTRPNPIPNPNLNHIVHALTNLHQTTLNNTSATLASIHTLAQELKDARAEGRGNASQVGGLVEASHSLHVKALKRVMERVGGVEKAVGGVGLGVAVAGGKSVMERLEAIEYTIGELMERAMDPAAGAGAGNAAMVTVVDRREMGVSPMLEDIPLPPQQVDVSVGRTPSPPPARVHTTSIGVGTDEQEEPLEDRLRASADALARAIGDPAEDVSMASISASFSLSPDPHSVGASFSAPEWSSNGIHPSSLASTNTGTGMPTLPKLTINPFTGSAPFPLLPARTIEEGSVASLRRSVLGDHIFARPLEDVGLRAVGVDEEEEDGVDPSKSNFDPSSARDVDDDDDESVVELRDDGALPSPPPTNLPEAEGVIYDLGDDIPQEPEPEQGDDPELAMKQELDASISQKLPSSSLPLFYSLSPLSSLEDDVEFEQVPEVQASEPRRSKRKSAGLPLSTKLETKKIKMEASTSSVIPKRPARARKRSSRSATATTTTTQKSQSKSKSKSRTRTKSTPSAAIYIDDSGWPPQVEVDTKLSRQFIQCDNCELWYHPSCVGVASNDIRCEGDVAFICPPCNHSTAKRTTRRGHHDVCARPDCNYPHTEEDDGEYFVERLIGRKPADDDDGAGIGYLWLVKWDGYPIGMAEWTPEENMGDCEKLVVTFNEEAAEEGLEVETDSIILLKEAVDGGWTE